MNPRPFRFGAVGVPGAGWLALAQQLEELGFDVLLMPDRPLLPAPIPALAAAAAATRTLGVGTYVLAASLHEARAAARDCGTLAGLFGDRFEPGIGAGLDPGTPEEKRHRFADLATSVRAAVPDSRLLMAASGRNGLALAGQMADTVALSLPPQAAEDDVLRSIERLQEAAGQRFESIELNLNLAAVGSGPTRYLESRGISVDDLVAAGSPAVLWGDPDHMAEQLTRRRERLGISYWSCPAGHAETMAEVMHRVKVTVSLP